MLKSAVRKAKLGREEEMSALKRLDQQSRLLERTASGPSAPDLLREEWHNSASYGGRSMFGRESD